MESLWTAAERGLQDKDELEQLGLPADTAHLRWWAGLEPIERRLLREECAGGHIRRVAAAVAQAR